MHPPTKPKTRLWFKRTAWLIAIWAVSIAALALVAYVLKLIMGAVGMTR